MQDAFLGVARNDTYATGNLCGGLVYKVGMALVGRQVKSGCRRGTSPVALCASLVEYVLLYGRIHVGIHLSGFHVECVSRNRGRIQALIRQDAFAQPMVFTSLPMLGRVRLTLLFASGLTST